MAMEIRPANAARRPPSEFVSQLENPVSPSSKPAGVTRSPDSSVTTSVASAFGAVLEAK